MSGRNRFAPPALTPIEGETPRDRVARLKSQARQSVEAARQSAEEEKHRRKHPLPVYAKMPEPTGDGVADAKADLNALQKGFRERAKDEAKRFFLATDSEYWACICFQTREQKEVFLQALDILRFGDKYLDGQRVARQLGIELPKSEITYNASSKIDSKWQEFIRKPERK